MRIGRAFFSLSLAFFYAHVFCHSKPQNNFLAFGKRFLSGRQTYHTFVHQKGNSFSRHPFFMYLKLELKLAKRSCL